MGHAFAYVFQQEAHAAVHREEVCVKTHILVLLVGPPGADSDPEAVSSLGKHNQDFFLHLVPEFACGLLVNPVPEFVSLYNVEYVHRGFVPSLPGERATTLSTSVVKEVVPNVATLRGPDTSTGAPGEVSLKLLLTKLRAPEQCWYT